VAGEGHDADAVAAGGAWGTWESAATTVLFSAPALLLFWKVRADPGGPASGPAFDAVDWLVIAAALAGGLALSFAAGGVRSARLYVTTGFSSCLVWLLMGWLFPSTAPLAEVYKPLVFADLAAHFNLLPLVLVSAAAGSRASLPDDVMPRLRLRMWGVGGAAAGLDVSPLVWLLAPAGWSRFAAFGWAGACIAAGGTLAVLVAAEIASHSHPVHADGAQAPPGS
jgi:hypothetical protein